MMKMKKRTRCSSKTLQMVRSRNKRRIMRSRNKRRRMMRSRNHRRMRRRMRKMRKVLPSEVVKAMMEIRVTVLSSQKWKEMLSRNKRRMMRNSNKRRMKRMRMRKMRSKVMKRVMISVIRRLKKMKMAKMRSRTTSILSSSRRKKILSMAARSRKINPWRQEAQPRTSRGAPIIVAAAAAAAAIGTNIVAASPEAFDAQAVDQNMEMKTFHHEAVDTEVNQNGAGWVKKPLKSSVR